MKRDDGRAPAYLGLEIGGTKLQAAIGTGDGQIHSQIRGGVEPGIDASRVRSRLAELVAELLAQAAGHDKNISGVGIGFGGPVDVEAGRTVHSHQVAGWDDFPLAEWASETFGGRPVAIHNDADTAALGEALFGAGEGRSPVLYVNSGSGVGGGLIVDGRIYRGGLGLGALEIGHVRLPWNFGVDEPGEDPEQTVRTDRNEVFYELEELASGWAIGRRAARWVAAVADQPGVAYSPLIQLCDGVPGQIDARLVAQAASRGDWVSRAVLNEACWAMSQALAQATTLLAPSRIILGGGVSLMPPELWLEPIRRLVDRMVYAPFRGRFDVVTAALGEDVVLHGALALARGAALG